MVSEIAYCCGTMVIIVTGFMAVVSLLIVTEIRKAKEAIIAKQNAIMKKLIELKHR